MAVATAMVAAWWLSAPAQAQLREDQVLVVYDSRIADSRAVAEHYAGSAKVPGGTGGDPGTRPGVRVVDLANINSGPARDIADFRYSDYVAYLRTPLRAFLTSSGLALKIRCLCLTKGLPHRIQDLNQAPIGDNPPVAETAFNNGNYNAACVDSELTLLWQNLDAGEHGTGGDSLADGAIANPYFRSSFGINSFLTRNMLAPKVFAPASTPPGQLWRASGGALATQLTPGDIYLVCRLDGNSVQAVRLMLDRSRSPRVNTGASMCLFDESDADGIPNSVDNNELDNESLDGLRPPGADGDDYEAAANALVSDGRFVSFPQTPPPASTQGNVLYNRFTGENQFFVGPLINYGGQGYLITAPVLLLATEGNNHGIVQSGFPRVPPGAGSTYPRSFNYSPGAVMTSIESANGRNFHGIGGNFGQASISDFLEAGGSFAIGNVWEPFTVTIPRNVYLVRNFILGNMTWAEAAYTALPVLSFQQIVVGDPLARLTRSSEDLDGDQAVSVTDMVFWQRNPTDINHSGTADRVDARILENQLRAGELSGMAGRQR